MFEKTAIWSATPGDSSGHMASDSLQKHVNKDYQFPTAFDHYSFFSSLNTSDRILGISWIGTACLKMPVGKNLHSYLCVVYINKQLYNILAA